MWHPRADNKEPLPKAGFFIRGRDRARTRKEKTNFDSCGGAHSGSKGKDELEASIKTAPSLQPHRSQAQRVGECNARWRPLRSPLRCARTRDVELQRRQRHGSSHLHSTELRTLKGAPSPGKSFPPCTSHCSCHDILQRQPQRNTILRRLHWSNAHRTSGHCRPARLEWYWRWWRWAAPAAAFSPAAGAGGGGGRLTWWCGGGSHRRNCRVL